MLVMSFVLFVLGILCIGWLGFYTPPSPDVCWHMPFRAFKLCTVWRYRFVLYCLSLQSLFVVLVDPGYLPWTTVVKYFIVTRPFLFVAGERYC